jgi:hypothetical protein
MQVPLQMARPRVSPFPFGVVYPSRGRGVQAFRRGPMFRRPGFRFGVGDNGDGSTDLSSFDSGSGSTDFSSIGSDLTDGTGSLDTSGDLTSVPTVTDPSTGVLTTYNVDQLPAVDQTSLSNYLSDASTSSAPSTGSLTSLLTGSGLNLGQVVSVLGQYLNGPNVTAQQAQYLQAELAFAQQQAQVQLLTAQTAASSSTKNSLIWVLGAGLVVWAIASRK